MVSFVNRRNKDYREITNFLESDRYTKKNILIRIDNQENRNAILMRPNRISA